MSGTVLAIDQGTTSTRAIVCDASLKICGLAQRELSQHFPAPAEVEHDPEEIWTAAVAVTKEALERARLQAHELAGIGITNQRETVVIWERDTGRPIHRAIVWQDRRTADACARLLADGAEQLISERTGLVIDPYFSATKIAWLLDHVPGARARAEAGELAFGTIDTFLLWRLTGGRVHATDVTNASRTQLLNIASEDWDDDLLRLFNIPRALLPELRDCAAEFGATEASLFGAAVPVRGIAGDQQAAVMGQACFRPGMVKSTYGTGCFALLNTGKARVASSNRLLTTIAYRLGGRTAYALEGSIFVAGAAIQWLRDQLKIISRAEEAGVLAQLERTRHKRSTSCDAGIHQVSAPRGGMRTRAVRFSASPAVPVAPSWARASSSRRSAIRPAICSTPCGGTGMAVTIRCCASMAAWRRRTGPCSACPILSLCR